MKCQSSMTSVDHGGGSKTLSFKIQSSPFFKEIHGCFLRNFNERLLKMFALFPFEVQSFVNIV